MTTISMNPRQAAAADNLDRHTGAPGGDSQQAAEPTRGRMSAVTADAVRDRPRQISSCLSMASEFSPWAASFSPRWWPVVNPQRRPVISPRSGG